jgi:dTDP-4-amino-4,6-dideoxygalactose transaminase
MKIGRTVPPAAAPLGWMDLWHGIVGVFSPGPSLRALEDGIRREFGVRHVFLVSSGKAALTVTLRALKGLSSRREVVIPAYTCFSVPAAIVHAGLQPALCDIDSSSFDFDHLLLERTLTDDTLCVIAHHLFGVPSAIHRIRALCEAREIFVIEDAAQAMGTESGGRKLGTLGDVGIFSLGRGKNITCGSGGIIVTNSDRIADAIALEYSRLGAPALASDFTELVRLVFMTAFIRPDLYWIPAAVPFLGLGRTIFPKKIRVARLSGMKAGLLRDWRSHLARSNKGRSETAGYFSRQLQVRAADGSSVPYLRFPIVLSTPKARETLYARSQKRGLGLSAGYPTPVSDIPDIRLSFDSRQFPAARRVAQRLLTLPTHHWLSEKDKSAIADLCRDFPAA